MLLASYVTVVVEEGMVIAQEIGTCSVQCNGGCGMALCCNTAIAASASSCLLAARIFLQDPARPHACGDVLSVLPYGAGYQP